MWLFWSCLVKKACLDVGRPCKRGLETLLQFVCEPRETERGGASSLFFDETNPERKSLRETV